MNCSACPQRPHDLSGSNNDKPDADDDRQHRDGIEQPKKHHHTGNHADNSDEDEPIPVREAELIMDRLREALDKREGKRYKFVPYQTTD